MKQLMTVLLLTLSALSAQATFDANTRAFIVVQNVNDPSEFFVERVPLIGCYGLTHGPQLSQLTKPYIVADSLGCGMEAKTANINYLVCAKLVNAEENSDYTGFSEVILDISQCEATT
ncbi:hypothetical protein [Bdellovibrio sp. HCB209]|uniref:hypothetical protein n=1 Tax=Bdellovibrio sp. HCB209 TaxID=3394354 RepID=UPI0039B64724